MEKSTLIHFFKNKEYIQNCANYRGIKIMCHTLKLWEKVIETRLKQDTNIMENQFYFIPRTSTTKVIHIVRRLCEHFKEKNKICIWLTLKKHMRVLIKI